jgi:hypothetical protein
VELLRKLSRDVATYFEVTDVSRRHSEVNKQADIRALVMDLKDSNIHTLVPGRTVAPIGSNKGKAVVDIFTEGKEVLERGAFRSWKDRTGKFGADVFGCDSEYQHQQEAAMGEQGVDAGPDMGSQGGEGDEVSVEFDPLADPEMEDEI